MTNTKQSPKSCSCEHCTRGKHTSGGRHMRRADERAYRHQSKQLLTKFLEDAVISSAPIGNYYD